MEQIKKLTKAGFSVKFFASSDSGVNGATIGKDVYVNLDGEKSIKHTIGHEFVHMLKKNNEASYESYVEAVKKTIADETRGELYEKYSERYDEVYPDWSEETFWEEYASDVAGDLAEDVTFGKNLIEAIAKENIGADVKKKRLRAIEETLRGLITKIRVAWRKKTGQFGIGEAAVYEKNLMEVHRELLRAYSALTVDNASVNDIMESRSGGSGKIKIPYREYAQLRDYIMRTNNSEEKLKPIDCKEIGNNFYVWKNSNKTDYTICMKLRIDGNEEQIKLLRKGISNGTYETETSIYNIIKESRSGGRYGDSGESSVAGRRGAVADNRPDRGELSKDVSVGATVGNIAESDGNNESGIGHDRNNRRTGGNRLFGNEQVKFSLSEEGNFYEIAEKNSKKDYSGVSEEKYRGRRGDNSFDGIKDGRTVENDVNISGRNDSTGKSNIGEDDGYSLRDDGTENTSIKFSLSENEKASEEETKGENIFVPDENDEEVFSTQIDEWLKGKMPKRGVFAIGKTPEVLKAIGAKDLTVVMNPSVLAKITGEKHDVSIADIKNIPKLIADPVMVFKSATVNNAVVILTDATDKNGNEIIVAMHFDKKEKRIKVNRVASVYGKNNIKNFVNIQIENGNLKYIDKNKSLSWSHIRGLQLPKMADTTRGFNNSILTKDDFVNREKMSDSVKFSLSENEKASEEETNVVPYTEHEKKNWENSSTIVVYENDEQFNEFVSDALNNRNANKKMYFGKIPTDVSDMVMNKTGVDIRDYNIALKGYEIRKILMYSHGNELFEAERGQEVVIVEDLKKIPLIITKPDNVVLDSKLYEGKPVLKFEKTINGKTFVVAYVSRKHHDITVQTMYKRKRSLATAEDVKSPSLTSETTSSTASSNDSILQNESLVNREKMSDSVKFSLSENEKASEAETKGENIFVPDENDEEVFSTQIDEWLKGKMPKRGVFAIGKTPEVLKAIGAKDLTIVMNPSVLAKITGEKHDVSIADIKNIPKLIADPVMVFKSATVNNAVVILTDATDKNGNEIIVAMHFGRFENSYKINKIASVYGKTNIKNFVDIQIENGNLKYIDKNKSQEWSIRRGLHSPKLNTVLDSNNSILTKDDFVNREKMSDSVKFSLSENEKASEAETKGENYTYDSLVEKDDMFVTQLTEDVPHTDDGKIDRNRILSLAIKNVRDKGNSENTEEKAYVYIPSIGKNVLVGKDGLRHGLTRRSDSNAKVTMNIGDILENSIKVNELSKRENTQGGYVLLGIGIDTDDNLYPTRIVVNEYGVSDVDVLDVLYAVNAKKKKSQSPNGAGLSTDVVPLIKGSPSKISISELLELVKENFADVLSEDVLKKYGLERPKSTLSDSVKFSKSEKTTKQTFEEEVKETEKDILEKLEDRLGKQISARTKKAVREYVTNRAIEKLGNGERTEDSLTKLMEQIDNEAVYEDDVEDDGFLEHLKGVEKVYVSKDARQDVTAGELSRTFGVGRWSGKEGLPVDVLYDEMAESGISLPKADAIQDKLIAIIDKKEEVSNKRRVRLPRDEVRGIVEYALDLSDYKTSGTSEDRVIPNKSGVGRSGIDEDFKAKRRELSEKMEKLGDEDLDEKLRLKSEKEAIEDDFVAGWIKDGKTKNIRDVTMDFCTMEEADEAIARARLKRTSDAAAEAEEYAKENKMTQGMKSVAKEMARGFVTEDEINIKYRNAADRVKIKELSELYKRMSYTKADLKKEQRDTMYEVCDILMRNSEYMRDITSIHGQIDSFENIVDYICRVDSLKDSAWSKEIPEDVRKKLLKDAERLNEVFFNPIQKNTEAMNAWKKRYMEKLSEIGIEKRSAESAAAQALGENFYNKDDLYRAKFSEKQIEKIEELAKFLKHNEKTVKISS